MPKLAIALLSLTSMVYLSLFSRRCQLLSFSIRSFLL
jgi:hypothetical protein